jgi:hypothetical protein
MLLKIATLVLPDDRMELAAFIGLYIMPINFGLKA